MLKAPSEFIIVFIIVSVILILIMGVFISTIIYRYQQKQNAYFKDIESLKVQHENMLLQSQLEIQEQTFQNISREIHDNIGQKLTLAKLHLNTFNFRNGKENNQQIIDSVNIIGEVISDLSDLSRSKSSEIILKNGLINALKHEQNQLDKLGLFQISFTTSGNSVFLSNSAELVLFRIIQEGLNNIIKHAEASVIQLNLHYDQQYLEVIITDNGKGFNVFDEHKGTGLQNIKKRTALLKGCADIYSLKNTGTNIKIKIPIYGNE